MNMPSVATLLRKSFLIIAAFVFVGFLAFAAETASITDKSDNGAYLKLDDGTEWLVDAVDRIESSTWVVGDDVVYTSDTKECSKYKIIDTDENGDSVCASPIN